MMVIRPEQLAVLAESTLVRQILEHLAEFFPDHCATLRPPTLRAHVEKAIARARSHGLTDGPHLCTFVDLVFLFGHEFDTQSWAARILGDRDLAARREAQMICLREAAQTALAERQA